MDYIKYIIYALIVWNIIVFMLYGADKRKAKMRKQRISEKTLLMTAFFLGGLGGMFGMVLFRHKTQHLRFKILVPLFVILQIAVVATGYFFWGH